ncbi:hypothetical protein BD410DRAFT_62944 [Rickenella mellea]|uniref:Uncharacterized protein n=1 Tax=Rickenella mellea TaxID=50990 RepID=A0A4Y7QBQ9_9AGAM|nr:hypothetical protein BD410DRAFT_62944 [Rickenella mellea]
MNNHWDTFLCNFSATQVFLIYLGLIHSTITITALHTYTITHTLQSQVILLGGRFASLLEFDDAVTWNVDVFLTNCLSVTPHTIRRCLKACSHTIHEWNSDNVSDDDVRFKNFRPSGFASDGDPAHTPNGSFRTICRIMLPQMAYFVFAIRSVFGRAIPTWLWRCNYRATAGSSLQSPLTATTSTSHCHRCTALDVT